MNAADQIKVVCIIGPIAGLLVLGFYLALRGGVVSLNTGHGMRALVEDLTKTFVLIGCCVLGVLVLHLFAGFPVVPLR